MRNPVSSPHSGARPNLFVVGDAKCGTTSLYHLFAVSPAVGKSRRKELHYFSSPELLERVAGPGDEAIPKTIIRDEASYLSWFAEVDPTLPVIIDVSPSYFRYPEAARRIWSFAPDARIIVTLREPAAKVFSQYVHLWSRRRETLSFEEGFERSAERRNAGYSDMFDYEGGGRYADAVQCYFDVFGRDRVLVLLFEELVGAYDATARARLEAFLGIDLPPGPLPRANVSGRLESRPLDWILGNATLRTLRQRLLPPGVRVRLSQRIRSRLAVERPALAPETRAFLERHFAPDVARLEGVLGRQTGWPVPDRVR
jgi:hypothetical protein